MLIPVVAIATASLLLPPAAAPETGAVSRRAALRQGAAAVVFAGAAPALAEDTVSSALHVVNDTHAVCMSPWRPAAGECELGVGVGVASGMHKACPQGARQASE